jgi:hypothetical protein
MGDAAIDRAGRMYDGLVKDPEENHWYDSSFFVPYLADGLAELSRATADRRYADEVRRNAEFAMARLRDQADGLYFRNWRLWRIDRERWDVWRRLTGGTHPLEADWDERSKEPEALKKPEADRPVVKTLLANAGMARLFRIAARSQVGSLALPCRMTPARQWPEAGVRPVGVEHANDDGPKEPGP